LSVDLMMLLSSPTATKMLFLKIIPDRTELVEVVIEFFIKL